MGSVRSFLLCVKAKTAEQDTQKTGNGLRRVDRPEPSKGQPNG